jgi:hypothetical protein
MQLARPAFAPDPRRFGRRMPDAQSGSLIGADFKLFAVTFLAGFVFVSVLIA